MTATDIVERLRDNHALVAVDPDDRAGDVNISLLTKAADLIEQQAREIEACRIALADAVAVMEASKFRLELSDTTTVSLDLCIARARNALSAKGEGSTNV